MAKTEHFRSEILWSHKKNLDWGQRFILVDQTEATQTNKLSPLQRNKQPKSPNWKSFCFFSFCGVYSRFFASCGFTEMIADTVQQHADVIALLCNITSSVKDTWWNLSHRWGEKSPEGHWHRASLASDLQLPSYTRSGRAEKKGFSSPARGNDTCEPWSWNLRCGRPNEIWVVHTDFKLDSLWISSLD